MKHGQALLVHGFNVWDGGKDTVGELRGYFAAEDVAYHILNYGHFGLWDARRKNDDVAKRVASFSHNSEEPVIAVGHSNGCAIIHLAITLYDANIEHAVYINPALDINTTMPIGTSFDVWHSPSDKPVKLARLLPKAKFRPWGAMGAFGSSDRLNSEVRNFNKETDFSVSSKEHSDVFKTKKLSYFGPRIVRQAVEKLNEINTSSKS